MTERLFRILLPLYTTFYYSVCFLFEKLYISWYLTASPRCSCIEKTRLASACSHQNRSQKGNGSQYVSDIVRVYTHKLHGRFCAKKNDSEQNSDQNLTIAIHPIPPHFSLLSLYQTTGARKTNDTRTFSIYRRSHVYQYPRVKKKKADAMKTLINSNSWMMSRLASGI